MKEKPKKKSSVSLRPISIFLFSMLAFGSFGTLRSCWAYAKIGIVFDNQTFGDVGLIMCGVFDAIFMFAYAISLPICGWLCDRFNLKSILTLFLFFSALSFSCLGILELSNFYNTTLVLLIFLLNGIFQAVAFPSCATMMFNWFDVDFRGAIMGIWASGISLGNIIGYSFAWYFQEILNAWQYSILAASVYMLLQIIFVMIFLAQAPDDGLNDDNTDSMSSNSSLSFLHMSLVNEVTNFRGPEKSKPEGDLSFLSIRSRKNTGLSNKPANNNISRNESYLDSYHNVNNGGYHNVYAVYHNANAPNPNTDSMLSTPLSPKSRAEKNKVRSRTNSIVSRAIFSDGLLNYILTYGGLKCINYGLWLWLPIFLDRNGASEHSPMILQVYEAGKIIGTIVTCILIEKLNRTAAFIPPFALLGGIFLIFLAAFGYPSLGIFYLFLALAGIFISGPTFAIGRSIAGDIFSKKQMNSDWEVIFLVCSIVETVGSLLSGVMQIFFAYLNDYNLFVMGAILVLITASAFPIAHREYMRKLDYLESQRSTYRESEECTGLPGENLRL